MTKISPLAPRRFPNLLAVSGVAFATGATGARNRDDLLLVAFPENAEVAGVLTRSSMPSAPVTWCREQLGKGGPARGLVVNAGNANAFTGQAGLNAATAVAETAAGLIGCARDQIYLASTGVIGEPLPVAAITNALPSLYGALAGGGWRAAAEAIHTTDTFAKGAGRIARIEGHEVVINGIAKGSGMIHPDMATMLAFIFTNAALPGPVLRDILVGANDRSFNSITVDGDSSTSDTVLAFATGAGARHPPVTDADDPRLDDFRRRFGEVMTDLAQQVVRDGEGAGKFITITVHGATGDTAARKTAFAIANSPLVKTAIAGGDANWGRIVMAIGKADPAAVPEHLAITIGDQLVTRDGCVNPDYDEARAARHLAGDAIDIAIDLGLGAGRARVWTCDLTHGYITINANYRS